MSDGRDIVTIIEEQLDAEDYELCDLMSMLEDAANEIRRLRGEPQKPKGF